MKKKVFGIILLVAVGATLMSNNSGVATNQSVDRTGSPVGVAMQCNQCHQGGSFSPTIALRLKMGGTVVSKYVPGVSYTYEVEITSSAGGHGFQTVALLNDDSNAGTMTASSANGKIVPLNNRSYAEQKTASGTGLFTMDWVAPVQGSGDVKFYAAGVAVNGNGNVSGDSPVTGSPLTISEDLSAGIGTNEALRFKLYPNPVVNELQIEAPKEEKYSLEIADISGKLVFSIAEFSTRMSINVSNWPKGTYLVSVVGKNSWVKKFNKI